MKFREFGKPDAPTVILLHGGGLSWWSLTPIVHGLKERYRVITPIIDGHGEDSETTFTSIEDSAQKLIAYIDEFCGGRIHTLGGLSIGAQIVIEVLARRQNITEYAIIESALVFPIRGLTAMTVPAYYLLYGLVRQKWFARLQARYLFIPEAMFNQYYNDSVRMSRRTLINITLSNGQYKLKKTVIQSKARTLIIAGSKELGVIRRSAETLYRILPGSTLHIAKNMGHGELSLQHATQYLRLLSALTGDR